MSEFTYAINIKDQTHTIVQCRRFTFRKNGITLLLGESGIGKTLLSKSVFGLLDDELNITINRLSNEQYRRSEEARLIRENGFFVFQEPSSHLNPLLSIREQLREGKLRSVEDELRILSRLWQNEDDTIISRILALFPRPYRPSGGEKQRILLAMAFKSIEQYLKTDSRRHTPVFVFDEPTGNLDDRYRNLFLEMLFSRYRRKPFTILLITHDYSMISELYRHHGDLLSAITFKELKRRKRDEVSMEDFSADRYLQWLQQQKPLFKKDRRRTTQPLLRVNQSYRIFDRAFRIYRDANHQKPSDLTIQRAEMVYLKAPSGAGKTTLAKMIMGLLRPQQFAMQCFGYEVTEKTPRHFWQKRIWGKKAGMVFQHADEALNLQATVLENFRALKSIIKLSEHELKKQLQHLFGKDAPPAFFTRKMAYVSGGQKQRLNLMRTLLLNTPLVILDEPFNGLDFDSLQKVMSILQEKLSGGQSFLIISHNEEIFDRFIPESHTYYLKSTI